METVEGEATKGAMNNAEFWIFTTDNSTAVSCLVKGSSKSKLLHELDVRLRRVEMNSGGALHVVDIAGTRMMAQGTDGLSPGVLNEGVMCGDPMLSFVDISKSVVERCPKLLGYFRSWRQPDTIPSTPEQWFREGHGIVGGTRDKHGIWIPSHATNGQMYLWTPPPIVADVAM